MLPSVELSADADQKTFGERSEMAFTEIDTDELFARMFGAARADAGQAWPQLRGICKIELKAMARQIKEVGKGVLLGEISQESGRALLRLSRSHAALIVTAMTAQTISAAESIINSALGEIRGTVTDAVGFDLL